MMKRFYLSTFLLLLAAITLRVSASLDSLRAALERAPVQEKVYVHMDNNCYFKGDTLWYKAYVVRADDHRYTDMSRILYVELVSPDGLVVERQQVIVSEKGYGCGDFVMEDSLYSGFYELRAYTRWMLNFCVTTHPYDRKDREQFYNSKLAADFFRQYGTIYSRVFPLYERPDSAGDYGGRYLLGRPKRRLDKELKPSLSVSFYPEGGSLIGGTRQRIAFEALTEEGEGIDSLRLLIGDGGMSAMTEHMGRGSFTLDVPEGGSLKARCHYLGKWHTFSLPKITARGVALCIADDGKRVAVSTRGLSRKRSYGCAVLCRGQLKYFQELDIGAEARETELSLPSLPTGVNDFVVFNDEGELLASRLFFVDNGDMVGGRIEVEGLKPDYEPYEKVSLDFTVPAGVPHFSVSVRDGGSDDEGYDTGNMLTELLLSSELQGFVAHPDYYFESRSLERRRHLDELLLVQGWRRYDFSEIVTADTLRYQPEKTMTVEGTVYKTVTFEEIEPEEMKYWKMGLFGFTDTSVDMMDSLDVDSKKLKKALERGTLFDYLLRLEPELHQEETSKEERTSEDEELTSLDGTMTLGVVGRHTEIEEIEMPKGIDEPYYGINNSGIRKEVTVSGELVYGRATAGIEVKSNKHGEFSFNIPPFYGDAILFLSAYKEGISEKKKERKQGKGRLDEEAWPDYYVKRNLFYPVFARKYDFYQCHLPQMKIDTSMFDDGEYDTDSLSTMDRRLRDVEVRRKRRRSFHAIDYSKPAYVYDTYELYNLVTDYGLSYGRLNFRRFPYQVSMLLLGNYNSPRFFNVDARMNDYLFYRSYQPDLTLGSKALRQHSDQAIYKDLKLSRQKEVRLFTDFELRNEEKPMEMSKTVADVTVDFVTFPDDAKQYTFRDRRIVLHGFTFPRDFYQPDYSRRPLPEVKDCRRTLYWNPNAVPDKDGRFHAGFYNGSRPVRMKVSAEGLSKDGTPLMNK